MIRTMGLAPSAPGVRFGPAAPHGPGAASIAASRRIIRADPWGAWGAVTTRPVRVLWRSDRAGLGENGGADVIPWTTSYHADGSVWEVSPTGETRMLTPPTPKPAPVAVVRPPGPVYVGQDVKGGYLWRLPDGSFLTTPTQAPPMPRPMGGTIESLSPVDDMLARPAICPPWCGPGGGVGTPGTTWQAQTPSAPPPAEPSPLPATSPGTLPTAGYVAAPNFSDPYTPGGPYSAAQTSVVAGVAPAPAATSPWVWVGAAVLGFLTLKG